jgi:hypothetical protein
MSESGPNEFFDSSSLLDVASTSSKSTVYGLNGHRSIFVIDLSVGTCEYAV